MTTQELKAYIDRILGNNIRLLLPSYWWKRVFGAVIDNTISKDEVKTINGESILGEGNLKVGVTTVGSTDELNTLEASVGDIATIGEESTILVSVGDLQQVDDPSEILEKWDNLTRIVKVEFGEPVTEIGYHTTVYLNGKKPYGSDTILITSSEGGFYCGYGSAAGTREITIEEVNERLKNHDYRFIMGINVDVIDKTYKLYVKESSANAYIKGDSWTRLLKEGDVTGGGADITIDSELSDTSENAVQNKAIKAYVDKIEERVAELERIIQQQ